MIRQYIFEGMVDRVIDGDTYDVILDLGFYTTHTIRVRLKGVDTPEVFGKAASEEGKIASAYVKGLIENKRVIVQTYKNAPSSFNRWEADIWLDLLLEDGTINKVSLADHLVDKGYATKVL